MRKALLIQNIIIFLLIIGSTLTLGNLDRSIQTIDRPGSHNKMKFTPPQNTCSLLSIKSLFSRSTFIEHAPILIDGNSDFISQATTEGWTGDGRESNPIIINNLNISLSDSGSDLIYIRKTDLHFQISKCILEGRLNFQGSGISLYDVSNCYIVNNTIRNAGIGINLESSSGNLIVNNSVDKNANFGILFHYSSKKNMILGNSISHNNIGIRFYFLSTENTVKWNNFIDNYEAQASEQLPTNGTVFVFNYWNDWTTPDNNADGIVDNPYRIEDNSDSYPLTSLYPTHYDIFPEGTSFVINALHPPSSPDFSLLIPGMALILIIPELYFGRRLSKALSRKSEKKEARND